MHLSASFVSKRQGRIFQNRETYTLVMGRYLGQKGSCRAKKSGKIRFR